MPALLLAAAVLVLLGVPAPSRLGRLDGPVSVVGRSPGPAALALAAVVMAAMAGGPVAAALVLLVAGAVARQWPRHLATRDRVRERAGAAEAVAVLAAELRAGRPPAQALVAAAGVAVGPLAAALRAAATAGTVGGDPVRALLSAADGTAVPATVRGLAACLQVCGSTGSSLAAAVDRLAEGLRAETEQRLAVEAELAGPRATAGLLAVLPLAGVALAAGLGARPVHVLLRTPVGVGCLAAGLGLDLLGVWWTGRIVAAAQRPR